MEPGMPEESEEEIGTSAEASKAAINSGAKIADTAGQSIAQVLLDMAMAPLLGIQIWGIGWKPVHLDLRMRTQILFDHHSAMGVEPVPDDDEGAGNVSLEVTEGDYYVIAADGMREVAFVDAARQGQPDHRGECTALADASQDRCLPYRRPRGPRLRPEGEAGLIDEHDLRFLAASLFLIRGQSCVSQARTEASSRSRA
jgi:hypothetical protein